MKLCTGAGISHVGQQVASACSLGAPAFFSAAGPASPQGHLRGQHQEKCQPHGPQACRHFTPAPTKRRHVARLLRSTSSPQHRGNERCQQGAGEAVALSPADTCKDLATRGAGGPKLTQARLSAAANVGPLPESAGSSKCLPMTTDAALRAVRHMPRQAVAHAKRLPPASTAGSQEVSLGHMNRASEGRKGGPQEGCGGPSREAVL